MTWLCMIAAQISTKVQRNCRTSPIWMICWFEVALKVWMLTNFETATLESMTRSANVWQSPVQAKFVGNPETSSSSLLLKTSFDQTFTVAEKLEFFPRLLLISMQSHNVLSSAGNASNKGLRLNSNSVETVDHSKESIFFLLLSSRKADQLLKICFLPARSQPFSSCAKGKLCQWSSFSGFFLTNNSFRSTIVNDPSKSTTRAKSWPEAACLELVPFLIEQGTLSVDNHHPVFLLLSSYNSAISPEYSSTFSSLCESSTRDQTLSTSNWLLGFFKSSCLHFLGLQPITDN